jgi:hypothetical protein
MSSVAKKTLVATGGLQIAFILLSASYGIAGKGKADADVFVTPYTRCLEPPQTYDYKKEKKRIIEYVRGSRTVRRFKRESNIGISKVCRHWDSKDVEIGIKVGIARLAEGKSIASRTREVLNGLVLRIIDLKDGSYYKIDAMSLPVGHRSFETRSKLVDGLPEKIGKRVVIYFGPMTLDDIGIGDLSDGIYWLQVVPNKKEEGLLVPEEGNYFFSIAKPGNKFESGLRRYEELVKKEIEDKEYDATDEYEELAREFPRMIAPRYRLLEMYFYSRKRKNKKRALEIAREMEAVLPGLDDGIPYMHTDVLRILKSQRKNEKEE